MTTDSSHLPRYLEGLVQYVQKPQKTVVGLHSGTSADGPGVVVARISGMGQDTEIEVVEFESYDYESPLRECIFDVFARETGSLDRVAQADNAIGEYFAECVQRILKKAGMTTADLDLIVSSGQVCYQVIEGQRDDHRWLGDEAVTAFLDLGAGSFIAERTGVTTVSNLRQRDIAAGGLGVPTVSYGDWVIFGHPTINRALHNLGGIANPTVIPAGADLDGMFAFDSGPANMILDALVGWITNGEKAYDEGGAMAAQGTVHAGLLEELMCHPFVLQTPPKGAARQLFGHEYSAGVRDRGRELGLSDYDLLATTAAFTAESIAHNYREFVFPRAKVDEILLAGGGAQNETVCRMIAERMAPIPVSTTEDLGIPVEAREVLTMVVIGNETVQGGTGNVPNATGSSKLVIAGDITPGRPGR
ncbi:MAG: anhydro-N-acetylmuramic acid kinase [Chloroflexota bacterium]|nr:anhydro-N-acetylmuramic acid kinase [Chloroflexota bacterium]